MASVFVFNGLLSRFIARTICPRSSTVKLPSKRSQFKQFFDKAATLQLRSLTTSCPARNHFLERPSLCFLCRQRRKARCYSTGEKGIHKNPVRRSEEDPELLKSFMRTVPHPVAIITSRRDPQISPSYVGATVSSFNTVCFAPEPIVSFNLLKDSATLRSISRTGYFGVNLLRNNSKGAALADVFTRGNDPSPFDLTLNDKNHPLRFEMWELESKADVLPPLVHLARLNEADDHATAFVLLCELRDVIEVGDHAIVLGRSVSSKAIPSDSWGPAQSRTQTKEATSTSDVCLSYAHGTYSTPKLQDVEDNVSAQEQQQIEARRVELEEEKYRAQA